MLDEKEILCKAPKISLKIPKSIPPFLDLNNSINLVENNVFIMRRKEFKSSTSISTNCSEFDVNEDLNKEKENSEKSDFNKMYIFEILKKN